MKRPEGFDASQQSQASNTRPPAQSQKSSQPQPRADTPRPKAKRSQAAESEQASNRAAKTQATAKKSSPTVVSSAQEKRAVRRAARERRAVERGEIKRFTRRARTRRVLAFTAAGLVALLASLLAVAVFSPILSLREITIEGTSRIDPEEVRAAVAGQTGTPLALLDFARIESELAEFPLIRSYVTLTVPPSTLLIQIVEREPLGVLATAEGFDVVDAAGIVLESVTDRPDGLPAIALGSSQSDSGAFAAVSEVLLSLPAELLANVDSISATTRDDVTFTLRGVGQSVVWGSADSSAFKSRVLSAMLIQTDSQVRFEFDVSAPESVVVTQK